MGGDTAGDTIYDIICDTTGSIIASFGWELCLVCHAVGNGFGFKKEEGKVAANSKS